MPSTAYAEALFDDLLLPLVGVVTFKTIDDLDDLLLPLVGVGVTVATSLICCLCRCVLPQCTHFVSHISRGIVTAFWCAPLEWCLCSSA